jgi:hypothetical protein
VGGLGGRSLPEAKVGQDLLDEPQVVNDGDDAHGVLANGAVQRVHAILAGQRILLANIPINLSERFHLPPQVVPKIHFQQSEFRFPQRRKFADYEPAACIGVRFIKGVPQTDVAAGRRSEFGHVTHECRNGLRIGPTTQRVDPRRIRKVMQHNHGSDACGIQAIKLIDVTVKFSLIERPIGLSLKPRPFHAGPIGITPSLTIHSMSSAYRW